MSILDTKMHHRVIILTEKNSKLNTSSKIRQYVYDELIRKGYTEDLRFAHGPADYFVIGGRWSGFLSQCRLNNLLVSSFQKKAGKIFAGTIKNGKIAELNAYNKLFKEFFPNFKGLNPFFRINNTQRMITGTGYSDDAQIVDKKLWQKLIGPQLKLCTGDYSEDPIIFLEDEENEKDKRNIVNKMWAVVIDKHT